MIERGLAADVIVKRLGVFGVKGGGRPDLAQGSFDPDKWDQIEAEFYKICGASK